MKIDLMIFLLGMTLGMGLARFRCFPPRSLDRLACHLEERTACSTLSSMLGSRSAIV